MKVVLRGDIEMAQLLLDNGAGPNVPGMRGETALQWAVMRENAAMVRLLLKYGANPFTVNVRGDRPMDLASGEIRTILEQHLDAIGAQVPDR